MSTASMRDSRSLVWLVVCLSSLLLPAIVTSQVPDTTATPTPVPCPENCADCSVSDSCTTCNDDYFRLESSGVFTCEDGCQVGQYKNFDDKLCESCSQRTLNCTPCDDRRDDCFKCETHVNFTRNVECEELCGENRPYFSSNTTNAAVLCRFAQSDVGGACAENAFLITGCACCVQKCPKNLVQDGRKCVKCGKGETAKDGKCVDKGIGLYCSNNLFICVGIPIIGLAVVVLVIVVVCIWRWRNKTKVSKPEKQKPRALPPSINEVVTMERRPLRTVTPETSSLNDRSTDLPPKPPPLREDSDKSNRNHYDQQVMYENREHTKPYVEIVPNAQAAGPEQEEYVNATTAEPATPQTPDYENKGVIEALRKNKPNPINGTHSSSQSNILKTMVPFDTNPEEEELPSPHNLPKNAKGYINKDIIVAFENEKAAIEERKKSNKGNYDNAAEEQEMYMNSDSARDLTRTELTLPAEADDDDDRPDYLPMDGPELQKMRDDKRTGRRRVPQPQPNNSSSTNSSTKPVKRPKPNVKPGPKPTLPSRTNAKASEEQELYLDMNKASNLYKRPGGLGNMNTEVPVPNEEPSMGTHQYYNQQAGPQADSPPQDYYNLKQ